MSKGALYLRKCGTLADLLLKVLEIYFEISFGKLSEMLQCASKRGLADCRCSILTLKNFHFNFQKGQPRFRLNFLFTMPDSNRN